MCKVYFLLGPFYKGFPSRPRSPGMWWESTQEDQPPAKRLRVPKNDEGYLVRVQMPTCFENLPKEILWKIYSYDKNGTGRRAYPLPISKKVIIFDN